MKRITKIFLFFIVFLIVGVQCFSFDYGVELSGSIGFKKTTDSDWFSNQQATLWATIPFDDTDNSLAIEGSFYGSKPAFVTDYTYFIDLDLFRLSYSLISRPDFMLSADFGRIMTIDTTGHVLNQNIDGADFHFTFPLANIDVLFAYTGLLNGRTGAGLMSFDDSAAITGDKIYEFGSKRFVSKVSALLPQIVLSSDLIVEILGQLDMRKIEDDEEYSEVFNTGYATIGLNGPISSNLFYTVLSTLQFGEHKDNISKNPHSLLSMLFSGRLDFFLPFKNHVFAKVEYNSANTDVFSGLQAITYSPVGSLYTFNLENLTVIQGGWTWTPMNAMNISLDSGLFLTSPGGTEKSEYKGTETTLTVVYKILSDIKLHAKTSFLFNENQNIEYLASLKFIFAL